MTTRMLINAQGTDQVRVAIVDGTELKDYQVEITDRDLCRGNIYRGVVANIQPSLAAAFIDIGEDRHGFLPAADVQTSAYQKKPPKDSKRPRVDEVLERGKPILVQATKDGGGMKGAALSTNVAIAGRYLVLTPFDPVRGISRKAEDDKSRKTIKGRLAKLDLPEGHGVIVRTNGLEQNQQTLTRDLNALLRMWKRVQDESRKGRGPRLLYSDQDLIVQALRDYLDTSIAQVIVDDDVVYEKARTYMQAFMPRSKTELIRYTERLPLFTRYSIEPQIDRIYERSAPLPSGGSIVIDGTEALTAIDVNSGRATKRGDHDESILNVNIEAANEVARQLRLRDIGGLVVVDFIDMRTRKHQSKLEKEMRDAMKVDKARYTVGKISPNGLLEINRQRIKQALHQRTHRPCPLCRGGGSIPSAEFAAAALLGKLEARVAPGLIEKATVAVHPEIADALQNAFRARLAALEQELDLKIEVISATHFSRNEERIDYKQREAAIARKAVAAFTSSDLATPSDDEPVDLDIPDDEPPEEEAAKPATKRKRAPRKRRRRKSAAAEPEEKPVKAKAKAKAKAPAVKQETAKEAGPADAASEQEPAKAKSRSRRRRRGGRGRRKSANGPPEPAAEAPATGAPNAAATPAAGAPAAEALVDAPDPWASDPWAPVPPRTEAPSVPAGFAGQTPWDDADEWNVGGDAGPAAPPAKSTREPKPGRRRRQPDQDEDAQPPHDDAWQSPLHAQPPDEPPARRSPLRRDRATPRWQWWGGGAETEPNGGFEPEDV